MAEAQTEKSSYANQIKNILKPEFPFKAVSVKKRNSVAWWVRIIDPRFAGSKISRRDEIVRPLPDRLPEEIQRDLTGLLMVAPEELPDSMENDEFENPSW